MESGVQRAVEYGELVAKQHVPGMEVCMLLGVHMCMTCLKWHGD